jgi:hypothetical protein
MIPTEITAERDIWAKLSAPVPTGRASRPVGRRPFKMPEETSVPKRSPRAILPDELVRANYFIARHQWPRLKKHWTCLAADRPHGWTAKDFTDFVASHHWKFARTMPTNPHSYTLRRNALHSVFDDAVRYVRDKGIVEYFGKKPYVMLHHGDHTYWSMGAPLETTILINRKQLVSPETVVVSVSAPPFSFPFLPSSVELLLRSECLDEDKRPLDVDDFEFLVQLVRESGSKLGGQWYLELDDYVYWARGTPEKALAIHRARRPA